MYIDPDTNVGYRRLTVSTVAVGLSGGTDPSDGSQPAIPAGARFCTIKVGVDKVRMRNGPTAPTTAIGYELNAGDVVERYSIDGNTKFIRSGAADATLDILYFS